LAQFSLEQIREFWTQQAAVHGQSPVASWSDTPVIHMEIGEILRYLADGDRILDLGCANGYSTLQFATEKAVHVLGVDYIPAMIEEAHARFHHVRDRLRGTAEFRVGDITSLDIPSESYDKVVVIRVIINLGTWERQLQGMQHAARVVRSGGTLLLSEATLQGWRRLNQLREEWELPVIPMPPFNNYLDQNKVIESLSPDLTLVDVVNFASSYFVGTRVLKPLLIRALGIGLDVANPEMEWNRWFSQLPPAGDYGTQKLFVFRKG
jgi:ubiquinone/menaquinone biosynthesis C-methylase UbiE